MIFKNLFKPRWQHSNPQVRRQALEALANDYEVLTEMVLRDPDPILRILAIERHTDLTILDLAMRTDADPKVRERATSRLYEVLTGTANGPSLSERLAWLEQAEDPALLAHVVRHGVEPGLRSAILERITDDEVVAAAAVADPDARVRVVAAVRLQDRTLLERVSKLSRNRDKGVHRVVQERLNALIEEEERPRRQRLIRERLCADVEALGRRGHWRDAATPLDRLELRWATAEGEAEPDVAERFAAAVAIARRGLAAEEDRRREQVRLDEELAAIRGKKISLCLVVENIAADIGERDQLSQEDAALAHTLLRTAESGWAQTGVLPDSEASALDTRFQEAGAIVRARLGSLLRRAEQLAMRRVQCARVEQALVEKQSVEERTLKEWSREWQAIGESVSAEDPEETALMQRFQTAMHQLREQVRATSERRSQAYASAEVAVVALEQTVEQGALKLATPALATARTAVGSLPADARAAALKTRVESCAAAVHKLLEWQRWSNTRERERLCTEVEALVGEQENPDRLATQIREMREAWNRLGPSEREAGELGERFNAACERAFEPCRIYFAEQSRQREEAAKQREALIARIDAFATDLNSNGDTVDWKAVEHFLQEMRIAWRSAGMVDRRTLDQLQGRFTAALEPLQQGVRRAHRRILKAKEGLLARAEAAQKLPDLRAATNEIKQIQVEWKSLGYAPRRQEQALWRRLRVAANDVFERRHAEVMAQETERNAARAAREALCAQLEHLAQRVGSDITTTQGEFAALEQQWATAPAAPREDVPALENRFRKAVATYQEAVAVFRRLQAWRAVEVLESRGGLCTALEVLAETDSNDHQEAVEEARNRWRTLDSTPDPSLSARFERACARACLPPAQRQAPPVLDGAQEAETWEVLLVRLEILTEVESPPESARIRLSHQVNRLAAGLGKSQGVVNAEQRFAQFLELLKAYYATGPVPAALRAALEVRLKRVLESAKATLL